jgi:hypothetical protein
MIGDNLLDKIDCLYCHKKYHGIKSFRVKDYGIFVFSKFNFYFICWTWPSFFGHKPFYSMFTLVYLFRCWIACRVIRKWSEGVCSANKKFELRFI